MLNFPRENTFDGGYSKELTNNIEKKNTYSNPLNGRIYSRDGVFSFSAIKGSKLVYQNDDIVKWLGVYSFRDEAIIFAKCLKPTGSGQTTEQQVCKDVIIAESFTVIDSAAAQEKLFIGNKISENSEQSISCYTITKPVEDPTDFQVNYTEVDTETVSLDFGEYYKERFNVANFELCSINIGEVPISNLEYYDTIISFKKDSQGNLTGTRIWTGAQNWPLNGKITCEGVEENEFYKRVYYSDAVNPRRVVNLKDLSLFSRSAKEFNQILDNVLLQPIVSDISSGGQLKAMKALYLYRIISKNGQVSEFSPFSDFATILPEEDAIKYRGGNVDETTDKVVTIKCNIINPEPSAQIECIALEFEALGVPTGIKNLGLEPVRSVVEFKHLGNEPQFSDNITIQDILEFKNTFKYCNDYTSKKNKLIPAGLRNSPIPTSIGDLEYLLPLHAWDAQGNTFESIMNPEPWNYRFIDPKNTNPLIRIRQKKYDNISSFGPFTLTLRNKLTGNDITYPFPNLSVEEYTNVLSRVIAWLVAEQEQNYFPAVFPNLKIVDNNGQLLFTYLDENIATDFSNYVFESNNDQFIETFQNDIKFLDPGVNQSNFIHGAESIGFNQGNGIRVTYREFKEPLLNQAQSKYDGNGPILDYIKPSGEKYNMKGEIYRLSFQSYDTASSRYFAIPIGDLMIPEINDLISYIDDQGNPVITSKKYVNQSVENGILYGHGIKMHFEVRLSCEIQNLISMYQILYVERTENDRTILCQGIAAPLNRMQHNNDSIHYDVPVPLKNKWNLPYYGGPVYEKRGLQQYDANGENFNYEGDGSSERIITHRGLMYFDSPDLYFNKISDQHIKTSKLSVVSKLNTDHSPKTIMEHGGFNGFSPEIYPKFSRKILENEVAGDNHTDELPRRAREDRESGTHETYFINVSVFAKNTEYAKKEFSIEAAETLNRGEIISGAAFGINHDVSNNAVVLPCMPWFFSDYQRRWDLQGGRPRADLFNHVIPSPGYPTTIIKTEEDLFTDEFIGGDIYKIDSEIRLGGPINNHIVYETYPLINIFRNNREAVYGGRTEQAYSNNKYIPLSKTIPVSKNSGAQFFDCGADTYVTLNIRTKNDSGENEIEEIEFDNAGGGRAKGEIKTWLREGAWAYVNVLETQVEPKQTYGYEFYKDSGSHNFQINRTEMINPAYFNSKSLKQFIPKPFQYKDDPNLGNVIAVSNVKIAGEIYDAWTMFKPNNFYAELEKNKGDVSNIFRHKEEIYAIQEGQTSLIYIGTDRILTDQSGQPINIKQGSGQVVDGHRIISDYGTSIRRAVAESDYGFVFFDEKNVEFIKLDKPMLAMKLLHMDYFEMFKKDPIIDTEAYYDHEMKESNIRIRTKSGKSILLSLNEMLNVFNGEYEYNNDLYINFDKKIYSPVNGSPNKLHELNEGDYLNLFGEQKELKIGFYVNAQLDKVFIHKGISIITSLDYPIKQVIYRSSLKQYRIVPGTHGWYKIREGNHTIPAKNESEIPEEYADLRGNWVYVEVTAESLNKNKVDILAIINHLRFSHQ